LADCGNVTDFTGIMKFLLAAAAIVLRPALAQVGSDETAGLATLIDKLPAQNGADAEQAAKALAAEGQAGVRALVAMLRPADTGGDAKARYALHGLAMYVSRPGAGAERKTFAAAVGAELAGAQPPEVKAFLIRQLQLVRDPAAVAPLARLLGDEAMGVPAAAALTATGGDAVCETLRKALPAAKGRTRVAIVQALGVLGDGGAAALVAAAMRDADPAVRMAALHAAAAIAEPALLTAMEQLASPSDPNERRCADAAVLRLADKLASSGQQAPAEKVYARLWSRRTGAGDVAVRIAALQGLATVRGAAAVTDELLEAIRTGPPALRAAAVRTAADVPGKAATLKWAALLDGAAADQRAAILAVLAGRADAAALPAVARAAGDRDADVRAAAMRALAAVGGDEAVEALLAALAEAGTDDARAAAADALAGAQADGANALIAAAIAKPQAPAARAALLGVLQRRGATDQAPAALACLSDADPAVRAAAAQALGRLAGDRELPRMIELLRAARGEAARDAAETALAAAAPRMARAVTDLAGKAIRGSSPETAAALLRVLGRAGGARAAAIVASYVGVPDPIVAEGVIRALADWPDPAEVAAPLLKVIQADKNERHYVLAFRKYMTVPDAGAYQRNDARRLKLCAEVMSAARRLEEKRLVLAALGEIGLPQAVALAGGCLDEPALAADAAATVVRAAGKLSDRTDKEVQAALEKVLRTARNAQTLEAAKELLK